MKEMKDYTKMNYKKCTSIKDCTLCPNYNTCSDPIDGAEIGQDVGVAALLLCITGLDFGGKHYTFNRRQAIAYCRNVFDSNGQITLPFLGRKEKQHIVNLVHVPKKDYVQLSFESL